MPPAAIETPSPAMSVLKSHLSSLSYEVEIDYWNLRMIKLQAEFVWADPRTEINDALLMYLFYNYLAIYKKDEHAYKVIRVLLQQIKPQYIHADRDFYDEHMRSYASKLDALLDAHIQAYDFSNILYFGLEVNLYQWIFSSIIAEKIKKVSPESIIVIGGIGNKDAAMAYLRNFDSFDLALWGEGEDSLLNLSNKLKIEGKVEDYSEIANIAYRGKGEILISGLPNRNYISLDSPTLKPNYDDFFNQRKYFNIESRVSLPVEASRGCHWKKCQFCYLNTGYKNREKSVSLLLDEIRMLLKKYGINYFQFLDNDIIANNYPRFNEMLDGLIEIKNDYPDFTIILAEIITKGIEASVVKKMALAGFIHVQIGYESPSNNLLRKIHKKNSFASNLLFIKYAHEFHIAIGGLNVLRNLLEETDEDIIEGISNLHSLRFFLKRNYFSHNISKLAVISASRYYKDVKGELERWSESSFKRLLPKNYLAEEDKINIVEQMLPSYNYLWDTFGNIEQYYLSHTYEYIFLRQGNDIIYREYCNKELINALQIPCDSIEMDILKFANDREISVEDLIQQTNYPVELLKDTIKELGKEGLLYHSDDYSEIVTIVDVQKIKN